MAKNNTVLSLTVPSYCALPSEGPILVEIRQFEYTEYAEKCQGYYPFLSVEKYFSRKGTSSTVKVLPRR